MMAALVLAAQAVPPPSPHMLTDYIRRLAETKMAAHHSAVTAASDWEPLRKRYMAAYREAIGPLPCRTPLNAKVAGRIERGAFHIEKIVFESRPQFYVSGNLYVPATPGRHAAVLLLSGHYELGKAAPDSVHQLLASSLARNGVVVFAIDPIGQGERVFQPEKDPKLAESCATEHCYLGFPCLLTGTNLIQYMVWDAIRAVDYLVSRPEVDPKRLAVTGISGGGTQTVSLMPLEPRLLAAAPTCYVTSRLAFLGQPADAEQCPFGAISNGLDHGVMIGLCAPRRYQVQATVGDLFPIQGARDSVTLAKHIYQAVGTGDRVALVEDEGGHAYTAKFRQSFYAMLGLKPVDETGFEPLPPEELRCTPTGQVKTSYPNARWVTDFNRERAGLLAKRRPSDVQAEILRVLGPVTSGPPPRSKVVSNADGREIVWLETEPDITVTVTIQRPSAITGALVLLLDDSGAHRDEAFRQAARADMERTRDGLLARGYTVASLEVRGVDGAEPKSVWDLFFNPEAVAAQDLMMCGASLFAGRVRDVLQCLSFLRGRAGVGEVEVAGWGQGGLLALTAAALDPKVARVAAIGALASYRLLCDSYGFSHPPSTFLWNVLAHYDLPGVAASVAPRPVLLARPVDAMMKPLTETAARREYKGCRSKTFLLERSSDALVHWLAGSG